MESALCTEFVDSYGHPARDTVSGFWLVSTCRVGCADGCPIPPDGITLVGIGGGPKIAAQSSNSRRYRKPCDAFLQVPITV
jgi:hypothetical protein